MNKIYEKIEKYLVQNFGKKHFIKDDTLQKNAEGIDTWGFNSIMLLTKDEGEVVYFRPLFKVNNYQ